MISSISYGLLSRYMKTVPRRSPAISIGLMIPWQLLSTCSNPKVWRFTFSLVDKTPKKRSFNNSSTCPPTLSSISSVISFTPGHKLMPKTLPFLLSTRILELKVSIRTWQMSLNTTLLELLLCKSLLIFLVLSNNWTLILASFNDLFDVTIFIR